jgi:hypothetical protein
VHTLRKRRYHRDTLSLLKFLLALRSVLFQKLFVFEFLLGMSETVLCSMSALQIKIVLLDLLQMLMLFVGTPAYLEPNVSVNHILSCKTVNCI